MANVAPDHRPGQHGGKQHLGVQAVHLLLFHSLFRRAGAGRVRDPEAKRLPLLRRSARAQVQEIRGLHWQTFNEQPIPAVWQADGARRAVLVLLGHPRRPAFGRHFEVPVTGNQPILPGHKSLLSLMSSHAGNEAKHLSEAKI